MAGRIAAIHSLSFDVLTALFDQLPLGVVVLAREGQVVVYNQREEELARRRREDVLGRSFFAEVAPCLDVRELSGRFASGVGRDALDVNLEFSFAFPFLEHPRDVMIRLRSMEANGEPYGVLLVEDVTAARSAERMREQLGNLLVHDLKNPLAAIIGNAEFALERTSAGEIADALEDVRLAAARLEGMVLTLLDIGRLESGAVPLALAPVDLREIVDAAAATGRAIARRKGVRIEAATPEAAVIRWVDRGLVQRAVDNLVENGIRYSPRGGAVVVRATADGAIEVEDDGPGIPEALRGAIFEKYVQVRSALDGANNRGLGLTLVQLAARAHGGDVAVRCPPSGGSVFRLSLPAPRAQP